MIVQNPIIGRASGLCGGLVFSTLHGANIVKSKPPSRPNDPSDAQLAVQEKFQLAIIFLKLLLSVVQIGWKSSAKGMSEYAAALSYFLKNSITGALGSFTVDFPNVILSQGPILVPPPVTEVSDDSHDGFCIIIEDNSDALYGLSTDPLKIIVFNPSKSAYVVGTGLFAGENDNATRAGGTIGALLPNSWITDDVHFWVVASRADAQSPSLYGGSFNIPF